MCVSEACTFRLETGLTCGHISELKAYVET